MKSKKVHLAYKLPNGVHVMISGDLKTLLSKYELQPKDLWKVGSVAGLCVEYIECRGLCITIMGTVKGGIIIDGSVADDIWCICPEGDCIGLIRALEPGIAFKDPPIYVSFEAIAKRIPPRQRKAFLSMIQEMKKEK